MPLDELVRYFETLSAESVDRLGEYYAADAWFKDPFNEVHGVAAIARIFRHMFAQLDAPRFVIGETIADGQGAMLVWEFHYRGRSVGLRGAQCIRGVTHLRFDADGRVDYHRDYWDAAEELYSRLPLLGALLRALRRRIAA
jgi:ketosteroid isomerase-like protein